MAAVVLKEAGFERIRLYDGSMSEWNNIPETPKETLSQ
jgi:3-mercaptopyruvate sulfurtransferase SseA